MQKNKKKTNQQLPKDISPQMLRLTGRSPLQAYNKPAVMVLA